MDLSILKNKQKKFPKQTQIETEIPKKLKTQTQT